MQGFTYLVIIALILQACSNPDRVASNLNPPDSGQNTEESNLSGSNRTFTEDTVRVVRAPGGYGLDGDTPGRPAEEFAETKKKEEPPPKRAPPPVGVAESVGYVPQPEEKRKQEDDVKPTIEKDQTVRLIPTLPPSIIQPGRMINGSWFIVLYAPWCSYSQLALDEFIPTVQYIVDKNISDMVVGKIDIIKNNDVAKHFRVKSTPTIVLVKNGIQYTFEGANVSSTSLIAFMLDVVMFEVVQVNTTLELELLRPPHSALFLAVYHEEVDKDWHGVFLRQAIDKCLKGKFAYTISTEIAKKLKLDILPAIVAIKDDIVVKFKHSLTLYSLAKWILAEKDLAFPIVNDSNLGNFLKPIAGRRLAILAVNDISSQRSHQELKAIEVSRKIALGREYSKKFQFLLAEGRAIPELLLRSSIRSYPYFFVYEPYTALYYILDEEGVSENSILTFFEDIMGGKKEPRGGITYLDRVIYFFQLANAVLWSMVFHRPYLSGVAGFCLCGVTCFYLYVCVCGQSGKASKKEIELRKAARARRRRELLQQKREKERKEEEAARKRIAAKEKAVAQVRSRGVHSKHEQEEEGSSYSGSEPENSQEEDLHED